MFITKDKIAIKRRNWNNKASNLHISYDISIEESNGTNKDYDIKIKSL